MIQPHLMYLQHLLPLQTKQGTHRIFSTPSAPVRFRSENRQCSMPRILPFQGRTLSNQHCICLRMQSPVQCKPTVAVKRREQQLSYSQLMSQFEPRTGAMQVPMPPADEAQDEHDAFVRGEGRRLRGAPPKTRKAAGKEKHY